MREKKKLFFFLLFLINFIEGQLIYNVLLISPVGQRDCYTSEKVILYHRIPINKCRRNHGTRKFHNNYDNN